MTINPVLQASYPPPTSPAVASVTPVAVTPVAAYHTPASNQAPAHSGPSVVVDISPDAWAAYETDKGIEAGKIQEMIECITCKSRKYVDSSNDASVSFKSPGHISPGASASIVASHEREHISNEQANAQREDRRVVSQSVSLEMSTCPECGRAYVSGGTARTLTASKSEEQGSAFRGQGAEKMKNEE